MEFSEYAREARKTAQFPEIGHTIIYPTLGLVGEAGEVAEKVKKIFRDHNGEVAVYKDSLVKELGDCLWYLSTICDSIGTTLEYVAFTNIEKLRDRKDRGKISGSGDNR